MSPRITCCERRTNHNDTETIFPVPWEKNTDYQNQNPNQNQRKKQKPTTSCLFILEMYMSNPFILFLIFILLNLATAPRTIYQDENQDLEEHFHYLEGITASEKPITIIIKPANQYGMRKTTPMNMKFQPRRN